MKQPTLYPTPRSPMKPKKSPLVKLDECDQANRRCALIILAAAKADEYSLEIDWANQVLAAADRKEPRAVAVDSSSLRTR